MRNRILNVDNYWLPNLLGFHTTNINRNKEQFIVSGFLKFVFYFRIISETTKLFNNGREIMKMDCKGFFSSYDLHSLI